MINQQNYIRIIDFINLMAYNSLERFFKYERTICSNEGREMSCQKL